MECDLGWWAAKLAETCSVMGLRVFWWARIAKIIGVLGGLIIVMDIIGVERIQSMAELGSKLLSRIGAFIMSALELVKSIILKALEPILTILGLLLLTSIILPFLSSEAAEWFNRQTSWTNEAVVPLALAIGLPAIIAAAILLPLFAIQLPFWWLSKPYTAMTLRVFALVMLIVSFFIDMAIN